MKDLIEALTIFAKYRDLRNPTHCSHDQLTVVGVGLLEVTAKDQERLNQLGFFWTEESDGYWISFRFGSA